MTPSSDRDAILRAVLDHVPFDGWSAAAYAAGVRESGVASDRAALAFSNGIDGVAAYFGMSVARKLEAALEGLADSEPSIRKRITVGVRTFIGLIAEHREQVRRLSPLGRSRGTSGGIGVLYRITDIIWRAAGDRSTDFSFYTKRGLLAGVVTATYWYWLDDESDGFADTWAFLDRRIADVLRIQKVRGRAEKFAERMGAPLNALRKSPFGKGFGSPTSR